VRLQVNGEAREAGDGLTVAELLAADHEPPRHVVVEVNGDYVPRTGYGRVLRDGDRVEIIRPAFGG
jgi:thiamine biosynthesis protein ThiS